MLLPAPAAGAAVVPDDGAAVVPDDGAAVLPDDGAAVVFDAGAAVVAVDELLLLPHAPRMSMPTAATPITERFMWSPLVSWSAGAAAGRAGAQLRSTLIRHSAPRHKSGPRERTALRGRGQGCQPP